MRRAAFCKAHFKMPESHTEPEAFTQQAPFLGMNFRWNTDRWVWSHDEVDRFQMPVPRSAPRRDFSSIVGNLMWDATVAMEGTSQLQEVLDIIRRLTKGVNQRRQWSLEMTITVKEQKTLDEALARALRRGEISVDTTTPKKEYVLAASDASKKKVGYVSLPFDRPTAVPSAVVSFHSTWLRSITTPKKRVSLSLSPTFISGGPL